MKSVTLILGGARSGKSTFAQQLASASEKPVVYVATAQPFDSEMEARITAHRRERPKNWLTLEVPREVGNSVLNLDHPTGIILLDCMTVLTSNILLSVPEEMAEQQAEMDVMAELLSIQNCFKTLGDDWIIVSNEVGLGIVPAYPLGRFYRDILGKVNQKLALWADQVYFMVSGIPMKIKG